MNEDYRPEHSAKLDTDLALTKARKIDARHASPEHKIEALVALLVSLDTGLKIVRDTHYKDPPMPEPFRGACKAVVLQGIQAIGLARQAGLLPERE